MARNLKNKDNRVRLITCAILAIMVVATSSVLSASATGTIDLDPYDPTQSKSQTEDDSNEPVTYSGVEEIDSDKSLSGDYASSNAPENAIYIKDGTVGGSNIKIRKGGSTNKASAFSNGTNAALLMTGGSLSLEKPNISTNGDFANGLFVNDEAELKVVSSNIITSNSYSSGVVVNNGGTANVEKAVISTAGDRSAALRVGADGGKMTVKGGQFKTTGVNSPAAYVAAEGMMVERAKIEASNSSSITMVEKGKAYFGYNNIVGGAEGDTKAGEPKLKGGIYLYQPVSGSGSGTTRLSLERNTINSKVGNIFAITNTSAEIDMVHNSIVYPEEEKEKVFMEIGASSTGGISTNNSGYGGASVELKASDQYIMGDFKVDRSSTLSLDLSKGSKFKGAINKENSALRVELNLSEDSVVVLTEDSYVDILNNAVSNNSNIYSNGFKLSVAGEQVSINRSEKVPSFSYDLSQTGPNANIDEEAETVDDSAVLILLGAVFAIIVAVALIIVIALKMRSSKQQKIQQQNQMQLDARARIEAQMRAEEQSPDFGKNQYPNVHV
ncbi:hypothetical protein IJ847_02825 [Candidatus Saccharibacteria bacterium]|nr:hypothetical protein [Candidatus Saccharibacteria bacterium]